MKSWLLLLWAPVAVFGQPVSPRQMAAWKSQAGRVTIIQDNWGIPHIYGYSDADAVFGLMYVECEQNFERVERNYLEVMGRLSEVDGREKLYQDLQMQLIYDSVAAQNDYSGSPAWFRKLLDAFADGVNYYLFLHPAVRPRVLKHFEPWYALMFTDGSISATQTGGLVQEDMQRLYPLPGTLPAAAVMNRRSSAQDELLGGSNGFALAPSRTRSGHAMLYINPHVTFYFRTEAQMASGEGLNVYGAVTWGQFFVYQGFNEHCGWMHTSSYADVADLYEEKIVPGKDSVYYQYEGRLLPVQARQIILRCKTDTGLTQMAILTHRTHHGPVVGMRDGKWLSLKEHNRSYSALLQSWLRTKANGFEAFRKVMDLRSNNSNNTVFADDRGHIAYWHGNFMPVRDNRFNYDLPLDGSTMATEWKGLHSLEETIHIYDPASGFIENCNSTPFTAAGSSSPRRSDYPAYMSPDVQNLRALNALRLFDNDKKFSLEQMIAAGYDHYLSAFAILLPPLLRAYAGAGDSLKEQLGPAMGALRDWDEYSSAGSVATTLAVEWGNLMLQKLPKLRQEENEKDQVRLYQLLASKTPPAEQLALFRAALARIEATYGTWKVSWGSINRFQRSTGRLNDVFSDGGPSLPVGLASARWGSLPVFETRAIAGSKKRYGVSGNSFIAAVEFGDRVRAMTIETGGESFDPASGHFNDQAQSMIDGQLKEVYFYKQDVLRHSERSYHPGESGTK